MSEYDGIRPFHDHEVPGVVARIVDNPDLPKAAAKILMPRILQGTSMGEWIATQILKSRGRHLQSVRDCQDLIEGYFTKLLESTISQLTVEGLDALDANTAYLFMSNHRDIVMDPGLLNYLLHKAGHDTCRMAVGDNLLSNELAADLMRLNKSFVVEREITGAKAVLKALSRTSSYIRHSLDEGVSIWIAQREGRAKDGWDRTDPALLKMLGLAYKSEDVSIEALIRAHPIVPISISYEIDPCALRKARELATKARGGEYAKSDEEDLESIALGMTGEKGRVHIKFHPPITLDDAQAMDGESLDAEGLATMIDRLIVAGLRVFPTNSVAQALLEEPDSIDAATVRDKFDRCRADVESAVDSAALFEAQLAHCNNSQKEFLLLQYANVVRNKAELSEMAPA